MKSKQPIRFPGQIIDFESELHYNRHRFFSCKLGRYITQDPIGLNGGVNFFSYVDGSPVMKIDPLGLLISATVFGVRRETTLEDAAVVGKVANGAMGVAGVVTGAAAAAAIAGPTGGAAVRITCTAACSPTGRGIVASIIQATSVAQKGIQLPVQPGLAGSVPTSSGALLNAARQSATAAARAASNNTRISRPNLPK